MSSSRTHIALLRGINVGGRNKIPMKALKSVCEDLSWKAIRTHLQTGNIVFSAKRSTSVLEHELSQAIKSQFGFPVPVIIRTGDEFENCVKSSPLQEEARGDPSHVLLYLTKHPILESAAEALEPRCIADEKIRIQGDALWIHFPNGVASSKLTPTAIDKAVGSPSTGRNWNTISKIRGLLLEQAG